MNTKLEVIRFNNEDVIATSCNAPTTEGWSSRSYYADSPIGIGIVGTNYKPNSWLLEPEGNEVNGVTNNSIGGAVLDATKYYHYKVSTKPGTAREFWECTDESHHDNN